MFALSAPRTSQLKFTLTNINFWLDFIISVSIIVALVEETWNSSLQTDTRHRLKKTELVLFFIGCLGGGYTVYMLVSTMSPQPRLCGVIRRLRIPGTIPGGYPEYPDQLRGGFRI